MPSRWLLERAASRSGSSRTPRPTASKANLPAGRADNLVTAFQFKDEELANRAFLFVDRGGDDPAQRPQVGGPARVWLGTLSAFVANGIGGTVIKRVTDGDGSGKEDSQWPVKTYTHTGNLALLYQRSDSNRHWPGFEAGTSAVGLRWRGVEGGTRTHNTQPLRLMPLPNWATSTFVLDAFARFRKPDNSLDQ